MNQNLLPNWLKFVWPLTALIGFIDATYLTVTYLQGDSLTCSIVDGCNQVLASSYSSIGPVPLSLLGALYYVVMLLGFVLVLDRYNKNILQILSYFSIVGFLISAWLFFVQWNILEAFCEYCLLSAFSSTILFILGLVVICKIKKEKQIQPITTE